MSHPPKHLFPRFVVAAVVACFSIGCTRSVSDEGWSPPVKDVDHSPVLSPEEALQSFSVPPGFRVELVAAEPLVADPVAIDIDPDGRIWAVEMRGFNSALIKSEAAFQPAGRVVVLEDEDSDGRMDKSTVFLDSLNLPRGVLVLEDGVLVAEPPHLWLARDTTGDLKADVKVEIRGDYGERGGNPEAMANSPTWGMDNWIHSTHYAGRLRHTDGSWQYDSTLALGQWGLAMNNYGRFFRVWNSNPLFVAMLDAHYFVRNPNVVEVDGADVAIAEEAKTVWPVRSPTWVDRGYREGVLREDSTLRAFTAASAPAAYRGGRYPEVFRGDVFVPEPAAHLVRRFEIIQHDDGTLEAVNAYDNAEFMASTDERFRPVNMYSAPDGTLYVVDMYRGVIVWHRFLTQYLKSHIERQGLLQPKGLGRIYRVVYEPNPPRREAPKLTTRSNRELVEYLAHPNGWWRDAAQQLLVEREAEDMAPALQEMARAAEGELTRLHALWTLDGLGSLNIETVRHALSDDSPHVRAAAVRLSEPWLQNGREEVLRDVAALTRDPAPRVRLQLAASLAEAPSLAADSALVDLLAYAGKQPYLVEVIVSGLKGHELEFMRRLVQREQEREESYVQVLQTLASAVVNAGHTGQINRMLQLVDDQAALSRWQRLAVLDGIEALLPVRLSKKPASLAQVVQVSDPEVRAKAEQIADRLVWPGKEGYALQERPPLTGEAKKQFVEGKQLYQQICTACHQPDGKGQEGIAPALVGSEWVLGQERDGARIVLDGMVGEVGLMPPHKNKLSNQEIAAILTYIRYAWGNSASPVSPSTVNDVRKANATRDRPWTEEALRVILH